jgi:hypothetical protein
MGFCALCRAYRHDSCASTDAAIEAPMGGPCIGRRRRLQGQPPERCTDFERFKM